MTRLELIKMPSLSEDQVRALLDQYAEGSLDPATARDVEQALAGSETLAAEYLAIKETMLTLRSLPRPAPPTDLAERVRAAIAADADAPVGEDIEHPSPPLFAPGAADVPSFEAAGPLPDAALDAAPARSAWMWAGVAAMVAAPFLFAFGLTGSPTETGAEGVHAAGVGADAVVEAELVVPSALLSDTDGLAAMAQSAGLQPETPNVFVGPAAAAKRFSLNLRQKAQAMGQDVRGFSPHRGTVRVRLVPAP